MKTLDIINWNNLFKLDWESRCRHEFKDLEKFWDEKAEGFNKRVSDNASEKYSHAIVNYIKLKSRLKKTDTFLDLGCGTGILSIPMAKKIKKLTACDISSQMLGFLKKRAEQEKIENIEIVNKRWMDVEAGKDIKPHDIVVSHRCLGVISCDSNSIPDLERCITKMNNMAKKYVFIIPPAFEFPDDMEFNKLFRECTPDNQVRAEGHAGATGIANHAGLSTYILVHMMGLFPHVDYILLKDVHKFDSIDEAVEKYSRVFDKEKLNKYFKNKFNNKPYEIKVIKRVKIVWWAKVI